MSSTLKAMRWVGLSAATRFPRSLMAIFHLDETDDDGWTFVMASFGEDRWRQFASTRSS